MSRWVERYIGLPFLDGGRTLAGCDCWGLVRLVYWRELGLDLPSYGDTSALDLVRAAHAIGWGKDAGPWQAVPASALQPFDVVVMRYAGRRLTGHVGLATGRQTVLHVEASTAAVNVPLNHLTIRERIECYRRHARRA